MLRQAASLTDGAIVFAYQVKDPMRYGVIDLDPAGNVLSIEEKPTFPRSNYAVPGVYFYDRHVVEYARRLEPSGRGEIEMSDLNRLYLEAGKLRVMVIGRGIAWLDAGTHESLHQAASFVQSVEERQGMMISCPEEISFRLGYIESNELRAQAEPMAGNTYGSYLLSILKDGA